MSKIQLTVADNVFIFLRQTVPAHVGGPSWSLIGDGARRADAEARCQTPGSHFVVVVPSVCLKIKPPARCKHFRESCFQAEADAHLLHLGKASCKPLCRLLLYGLVVLIFVGGVHCENLFASVLFFFLRALASFLTLGPRP